MNNKDFVYYVSIFILLKLLDLDLITKDVYEKVNTSFIEKFNPMFEKRHS